jgi:NAD(P)-dependent dehydrogenase (short-subunit alcohol dehydrogenase family)
MSKKIALITGASKGIGLAISQKLAVKGCTVIGIARHKPNSSYPGHFFACDLSNAEETNHVLDTIKQSYRVNVIVNNVGIALPQPLGKVDLTSLQAVYDLNVRTAVQITQAFIEDMKADRWGRVINISSRAILGSKDRSSYSAAKSALIGLTHTWALELAPFGITVNAIAPGPVETELFREARPVGSDAEKAMLATVPMNRLGTPEEIAIGAEFLAADEAGYITGQTIFIDGGASL